ncbi:hypothetical protein KGQ24_01875 [Patescibacteria group bacterium]|nr:hypothetical protein [Patescibacteria group bacterium]
MDKLYLGVAGQMLSGKDYAANFFVERFHAGHLKVSAFLDKILNILDLEVSRENEQKLGSLLRELYGEEIMSKTLVAEAEKMDKPVVVLSSIRRLGELAELKKLPNFRLLFIHADEKVRYQRQVERGEKAGERGFTFEQFQKQHEHSAEQQIDDLQKEADFTVDNNGTQQEFEAQLTKAITQSL